MSGGSFDYNCFRISQFSEEILNKIKLNNVKDEYGYSYDYAPETLEKLTKAAEIIKIAGELAHDIEWMYSGDIGEDTFQKTFDQLLMKLFTTANKSE